MIAPHLQAERLARLPKPEFDPALPVNGRRDEIRAAIEQHQVVIICGETGSGKTTQIPKILLEMQRGVKGWIGHTQPRRIAARSVASRIAQELNLLEFLRETQLPLDGNDQKRCYETELKEWHSDDVADPRFADLMRRHGWLAVGSGLNVRPRHHLDALGWQDAMDPDWASLWVRFCYQGMYSRRIIDERIRHLCMVGNCVAVGEITQMRGHMRGALRIGLPPREILEVVFQSSIHFGMPLMIRALQTLIKVLKETDRLAEIGSPVRPEE